MALLRPNALVNGYNYSRPINSEHRRIKLSSKKTWPSILTKPEIAALLRAAEPTWLYPPVFIAVTTAMLHGELLGLHWSDIDFSSARLTVNRS